MKKLIVVVMVLCGIVLFVPGPGAVFASDVQFNNGICMTHRYHENKIKVGYEVDLQTKVYPNVWAGGMLFMNNKDYLGYGLIASFDYPTCRRNIITWKIGVGVIKKKMALVTGFEF